MHIYHPRLRYNFGLIDGGDLLAMVTSERLQSHVYYYVKENVKNIPSGTREPCIAFYVKASEIGIDYYVELIAINTGKFSVNYFDSTTRKWNGWKSVSGGTSSGGVSEDMLNDAIATEITRSNKYTDDAVKVITDKLNNTSYGLVVTPEVKTYDGVTPTFTLNYVPKFAINVYIVKPDDSFYMLQDADYSIYGNSITIIKPALESLDRLKIIYAI